MSYTTLNGGRPDYAGYIADEADFSRWSGLTTQNHLASVFNTVRASGIATSIVTGTGSGGFNQDLESFFNSYVTKKSNVEYNWNLYQYPLTPRQVFTGTHIKLNLKRRRDER